MILFLSKYLNSSWIRLFNYISVRSFFSAVLSLLIAIIFGKWLIKKLSQQNVKTDVRFSTIVQDKDKKKNTPTMGGIIIVLSTVVPTVIFASLSNVYIILLLITTLLMGFIGLIDDYIKVFKNNREGVSPIIKLIGQAMLGIIIGGTLYFHKSVVIREYHPQKTFFMSDFENNNISKPSKEHDYKDYKSTKTNVPFFKNNELDYSKILNFFLPFVNQRFTYLFYILIIICVIIGVSNGTNFTDGLDGMAASTASVVGLTLAIFAYLSGNVIFSKYLNILYIPGSAELSIFCASFIGGCIGFLWYNAYPSTIFMGDTGSLCIGAIIAVLAISIRKELLLPLLCGGYMIEVLSVIIQVSYFKITKKIFGKGRRVFLMAPIHHHFQQKGIHEAKIVVRFLIITIILAILSLVTLKVR